MHNPEHVLVPSTDICADTYSFQDRLVVVFHSARVAVLLLLL
jgi:hypothetical protein